MSSWESSWQAIWPGEAALGGRGRTSFPCGWLCSRIGRPNRCSSGRAAADWAGTFLAGPDPRSGPGVDWWASQAPDLCCFQHSLAPARQLGPRTSRVPLFPPLHHAHAHTPSHSPSGSSAPFPPTTPPGTLPRFPLTSQQHGLPWRPPEHHYYCCHCRCNSSCSLAIFPHALVQPGHSTFIDCPFPSPLACPLSPAISHQSFPPSRPPPSSANHAHSRSIGCSQSKGLKRKRRQADSAWQGS